MTKLKTKSHCDIFSSIKLELFDIHFYSHCAVSGLVSCISHSAHLITELKQIICIMVGGDGISSEASPNLMTF